MSDRNEWFKDVKRLIRGLEVETVEDPFACPTVKSVTDGEDVLHALGLHPSRDVCGIVNVDIDEVYGLIRHIEPEPVTGSTSDGYHTFDRALPPPGGAVLGDRGHVPWALVEVAPPP